MSRFLLQIMLSCVTAAWLSPASAENAYPDKPIKLIVAFAPGTGSDTLARIMAASMGSLLGQPIITDNRSGVGGVMGTEQGARAPADGYTLTLATTSTFLTNPALNAKVRYRALRDSSLFAVRSVAVRHPLTSPLPTRPEIFDEISPTCSSSGPGTCARSVPASFFASSDAWSP